MQWPKSTHMNSPVAVWCLIWLGHDFACFSNLTVTAVSKNIVAHCTKSMGKYFFFDYASDEAAPAVIIGIYFGVSFLTLLHALVLLFFVLQFFLAFFRKEKKISSIPIILAAISCFLSFFFLSRLLCYVVQHQKMQKHTWCAMQSIIIYMFIGE